MFNSIDSHLAVAALQIGPDQTPFLLGSQLGARMNPRAAQHEIELVLPEDVPPRVQGIRAWPAIPWHALQMNKTFFVD